MRYHLALCLLLLVCTLTSAVRADPLPIQDIPPGDDVIAPLKKGDAAPFDGQLFNQATALRWANWLKQYQYRLKADVELEKKRGELSAAMWEQKYQIQKDFYNEQLTTQIAARKELQIQLDNRPWYSSVWFGAVLGVVGTGLLVGGTAYALHATK